MTENTENREASVKATIQKALEPEGWVPVSEFDAAYTAAIAKKVYETEVGPKAAHLELICTHKTDASYRLGAVYQSEGRNVLSTVSFRVPSAMTADEIAEGVQAFHEEVERKVDESYARRLLLKN